MTGAYPGPVLADFGACISANWQFCIIFSLCREPVMADFDEADQAQLGYYARWHPGSCEHGQLAVLLAEMGNRLSFFTES